MTTEKQLLEYLKFRVWHLRCEKQKIPFVLPARKRSRAIEKLAAKMSELDRLRGFIQRGNFKGTIEYEKSKAEYLESKKIEILKKLK
jgi:hypothetical protein